MNDFTIYTRNFRWLKCHNWLFSSQGVITCYTICCHLESLWGLYNRTGVFTARDGLLTVVTGIMNGISFWGTEYEFHNPQIDTSYYQHMLMLNRLISILLYTWAAIKFDSGFCWPEYNVSRYSSSTENQWHMQGLHTPLCRCHNHRLHQTSN